MDDRPLSGALRAFAEEAAGALATDVAAGSEVPFELSERRERRRATPLYCYRPLTGAFIRDREARLRGLATFAPAVDALARREGLERWLETRSPARAPRDARKRAEAALQAFLDDLFEDSTDFTLDADRLRRLCEEIEAVTTEGAPRRATLVAALPGLRVAVDRLALADDLALVRAPALRDAPPDAAWIGSCTDDPNTLAVLSLADAADAEAAPHRLRRLLRALRLYDEGAVGLAPVAWVRADGGPWRIVWLDGSAARDGAPLAVPAGQEDELRAFCNLIARRTPRRGELAWALARFELACERPCEDALSDLLLALRALLEPEGPPDGLLGDRVAALCAEPYDREALAVRVAHAEALERAVVGGLVPPAAGVDEVVEELTDHLRALLRDAVCGHLDSDLRRVADEILA